MKKTLATLFCGCLLSLPALAEKGASVMFDPPPETITATPPMETPGIGDKCQELLQKIEDLEGQPQKRHTARQRYQQECLEHPQ